MAHWNPFSKTYLVKCPDGSEKRVFKRPDDAFPLHLDRLDLTFAGGVKTEFLKRANLEADFRKRVDALLFSIDSRNGGLMAEFRAAYVVYQTDPCTQTRFLTHQVAALIEEQQKLRAFDAAIVALANLAQSGSMGQEELSARLAKIFDDIDPRRQQSMAIARAFESSRQAALSLSE